MSGGETAAVAALGDAELQQREEVACAAARAAGDQLLRRFRPRQRIAVETKGLHDYVTEADRTAERTVVEVLLGSFPQDGVLAEEGSAARDVSGRRWVIDPLDGTTNFIHGVPTFAVSVALEDASGLLVGVVHDPVHGETFHARRGGGARLNGDPISCSRAEDLHDALIATGFPFREMSRVREYLHAFESFLRGAAGMRRAGSASLDLVFTACGRYDGFWEVGLSRWDIAAGALIVQEAGGLVTDVAGGGSFLASGDVVAAGARLHPRLVEITRPALAGR